MQISAEKLEPFVAAIFAAAGSGPDEAAAIAAHLVEANLVGHDSHGVLRVPAYIRWLKEGKVLANRRAEVVAEADAFAVVDGGFGFGQVIGRQATAIGCAKARQAGIALVALRNAGHLGRIGAWAEQAAREGCVSLHFVNTSGLGILVAPHGGRDRRLSANPVAAAAPLPDGRILLLDMSTCIIAEGKVQVARNAGQRLPEGAVIDAAGRPTTDPADLYGPPPGALLPVGGHKGSGLSVFCEVLAGALTGGGCSNPRGPTADRLVNNMLSIFVIPERLGDAAAFSAEVDYLAGWIKAAPPADGVDEVLLPGEPEARRRAERLADGIALDETTWGQLVETGAGLGVAAPPAGA